MAATLHRFANPARFLRIARPATPIFLWAGLAMVAVALVWGLFIAPEDYLQGESVRILYIHVPSAWLGLAGYSSLAIASAVALVWRHPLAEVAARAIAPVGATFAALCLITGSLWGRPTWGTYWVWDARLTSMLVLFFLYLAYIGLASAHERPERGGRAASILAIVGAINLPIVKYSVEWWNTLHQGESVSLAGSSVDPSMLWPLLLSATGFTCLFTAIILMRMRTMLAGVKLRARAARMAGAAT
jgi:heme exporter protein C